jgi:hypothetical protein
MLISVCDEPDTFDTGVVDTHGARKMSESEHGHGPPHIANSVAAERKKLWADRYAEKHRWDRLNDFPVGIRAPVKVRIYRRTDHFILQWWDPGAKRNLTERINGDLLAALSAARKIDERLANQRTAGTGRRRMTHEELVRCFQDDLKKRVDAGSLSLSSARRFSSALRYYSDFTAQPAIAKEFPLVANVNREFRLTFDANLSGKQIHPNGHANTPLRPMKGQTFVIDTVRAMLEWAADPERGNLLPDTFRNPFRRPKNSRDVFKGDPLAEPDITLGMAADFVKACDLFQLRIFVPLGLFGLRAAEPCLLFREHLEPSSLRVCCIPELLYFTKGRRDRRLPLVEELGPFWEWLAGTCGPGLLYLRRSVVEGQGRVALTDASLADLVREFQSRCAMTRSERVSQRIQIRKELLQEAGALNYDHIDQEFRQIARRLDWPPSATLKDFRHAFATMLGNTSMSEAYKKYLMGQSPGKAALNAYTHLNQLHEQFRKSVTESWPALIEAVLARTKSLGHVG